MKRDEIAEIRARAEAATEGPWREMSGNVYGPAKPPVSITRMNADPPCIVSFRTADGVFIAHARTDIPALITALDHQIEVNAGLAGQLGHLVSVIKAHDVALANCDGDGPNHCDCLDRTLRKAKIALNAYSALEAQTAGAVEKK